MVRAGCKTTEELHDGGGGDKETTTKKAADERQVNDKGSMHGRRMAYWFVAFVAMGSWLLWFEFHDQQMDRT